MTDSIKRLKELVGSSDNIVFFGGAGVSTESGIPDFRSTGGLYHQEWKYPPEVILSHTFYESNPEEFFRFYRAKLLAPDAKPNAAHKKLAEWEAEGRLKAVITQNIDGLHQAAGSRNVLELHGSVLRNHCLRCGKFYGVEAVAEQNFNTTADQLTSRQCALIAATLPNPLRFDSANPSSYMKKRRSQILRLMRLVPKFPPEED